MNWRVDSSTAAATTAINNHTNDQSANIPTATEVDPSLYDELKLGKEKTYLDPYNHFIK